MTHRRGAVGAAVPAAEEDFTAGVPPMHGVALFMPDASTAVGATAWLEALGLRIRSRVVPVIRGVPSLATRAVR
jgi:hypothetical protein